MDLYSKKDLPQNAFPFLHVQFKKMQEKGGDVMEAVNCRLVCTVSVDFKFKYNMCPFIFHEEDMLKILQL